MSDFVKIKVVDDATPILLSLLNTLGDKTLLHKDIADDMADYTRFHIREASKTRHKTAEKLKSKKTGYLSDAAETVEATSDAYAVIIRVSSPIFKRVAGPVTIRPRGKKYLTIPIHKDAVGKKAQELWWNAPKPKGNRQTKRRRRLIQGLFFVKSKKGNLLLAKSNGDGTITPYYALKTSVILPQDEGLLPSAKQMGQVAEKTAAEYLEEAMQKKGIPL
jgi:predicted lipoprotein